MRMIVNQYLQNDTRARAYQVMGIFLSPINLPRVTWPDCFHKPSSPWSIILINRLYVRVRMTITLIVHFYNELLFEFGALIALEVEGSTLDLSKISRLDMGVYLCIASNGVPPTVSKRIYVSVDCKFLRSLLGHVNTGCQYQSAASCRAVSSNLVLTYT